MASAGSIRRNMPVRALVLGYPKVGKTGALAPLVNAGFKLRILDYDGNLEPLFLYADPAKMDANVDILQLEDRMRYKEGEGLMPIGIPTAFTEGLQAMDKWKYRDENGNAVDLGASRDWGPDTIMVLDSLTAHGQAALNWAMVLANKTPSTTTDRVYNLAIGAQVRFIKELTSTNNHFHVLVLTHIRMIAPRDLRKGDSEIAQQVKKEIASLVDTRLYPNALGYQWPQEIGGEFPTIIQVKSEERAGRTKRYITAKSRAELDLGIPALDLPDELDIKDGMLRIFQALSPASVAMVQEAQKEKA